MVSALSASTARSHTACERIRPIRLLGVDVDAITPRDLLKWLPDRVATGETTFLANHNLHSIALFHEHRLMRDFYGNSDLTLIDGMPIVAAGRLLGKPLRREHRISWLDHLPAVFALAEANGWRVAHLGGAPGIGEQAAQRILASHPRLQLSLHHGHFRIDGPEEEAVMSWLEALRPHLVLVGMGMPRQETWLASKRPYLPPSVYITCGATFDYLAGKIPTAPRWLGQCGLEWAFRLASEPRRLAGRYLIEPLALFPWLLRDLRTRGRDQGR